MKKHTSVFFLAARRALPGFGLLLALMAAAETLLFYLVLGRGSELYPEALFDKAGLGLVCGVGFVALCALLVLPRLEMGGKQGYALRRFSLPRWEVWLWESASNALCFLIFWGVQLGIVLALFAVYESRTEALSPQSLLLTFYRNEFLHSLLPLREGSRWVRNIFFVLSLGAMTAAAPLRMYVGKKGSLVWLVFWMAMIFGFFGRGIGSFSGDLFFCALGAVTLAVEACAMLNALGGEEDDEI